jgi:two-component system, NarL family, nitrate/nitrite response regulator NarL
MAPPTVVMIIDDHPLIREAIEMRVALGFTDVTFSYVGASLAEALSVHASLPADIAILDLDLRDETAPVANVAALVDGGVRIVILSALANPETVRAALKAGAMGFVSKSAPAGEFEAAFSSAVAGEPYTSPDIAGILASEESLSVNLSERERTALVLYASGLKLEAVARRMDVKPASVQEYIKRVRHKYLLAGTPLPTKMDLYRKAKEEGLVT